MRHIRNPITTLYNLIDVNVTRVQRIHGQSTHFFVHMVANKLAKSKRILEKNIKPNIKTKSCCIWVLFWRIPKGFLILTTFRGCTRSGVGRQYQSDFSHSCAPPKSCQNQTSFWDPSKQHPNTSVFGWIFYLQTCFTGTA